MHQACILTKSISNRVGFTRPQVAQLTMYKECVIVSEASPILYMSHFAYACKMRYPLNLVLESWEYLWFY